MAERRPVEIRPAVEADIPAGSGDPRGARQRRPGRGHRRRRAVPPAPPAVRARPGRGRGRRGGRVRRRRSTPADRSTSRTCSSGRTGWARASAGRCSRTRSATPTRRTTFASDDPRGPAALRPGRDARLVAEPVRRGHGGPAAGAARGDLDARRDRRRAGRDRADVERATTGRRPGPTGRSRPPPTTSSSSMAGRSSRSGAPASGSTARSASWTGSWSTPTRRRPGAGDARGHPPIRSGRRGRGCDPGPEPGAPAAARPRLPDRRPRQYMASEPDLVRSGPADPQPGDALRRSAPFARLPGQAADGDRLLDRHADHAAPLGPEPS